MSYENYKQLKYYTKSYEYFNECILGSAFSYQYYKVTNMYLSKELIELLGYTIYTYYKDNKLAYLNFKDFISNIQLSLLNLTLSHNNLFMYLQDIISNDKLNDRGGIDTTRTSQTNIERKNFTKQANTPTAINPTSSFVDDYTDYQSDTETNNDTTESGTSSVLRKASVENVLDVYDRVPRDVINVIVKSVGIHFITMEDDEDVVQETELKYYHHFINSSGSALHIITTRSEPITSSIGREFDNILKTALSVEIGYSFENVKPLLNYEFVASSIVVMYYYKVSNGKYIKDYINFNSESIRSDEVTEIGGN